MIASSPPVTALVPTVPPSATAGTVVADSTTVAEGEGEGERKRKLREFANAVAAVPALIQQNNEMREELERLKTEVRRHDEESEDLTKQLHAVVEEQERDREVREAEEPFPDTWAEYRRCLLRWLPPFGWFGGHHYYRGDYTLAFMFATSWGLFGFGWAADLVGMWLLRADSLLGRLLRVLYSVVYLNVWLFVVDWFHLRFGPPVPLLLPTIPTAELKMFVVMAALGIAREMDPRVCAVLTGLALAQSAAGRHANFSVETLDTFHSLRAFTTVMFAACYLSPALTTFKRPTLHVVSTKFVRTPRRPSRALKALIAFCMLGTVVQFVRGVFPDIVYAYWANPNRAYFWYPYDPPARPREWRDVVSSWWSGEEDEYQKYEEEALVDEANAEWERAMFLDGLKPDDVYNREDLDYIQWAWFEVDDEGATDDAAADYDTLRRFRSAEGARRRRSRDLVSNFLVSGAISKNERKIARLLREFRENLEPEYFSHYERARFRPYSPRLCRLLGRLDLESVLRSEMRERTEAVRRCDARATAEWFRERYERAVRTLELAKD